MNAYGAAYIIGAVLPAMQAARSGAIVNTSSALAAVGMPDRVVYGASKGALPAMTRAIAADEIGRGIRVNAVSPATVDGSWVLRNAEASGNPDGSLNAMRRRQPTGQLISAAAVVRAITYLAIPRSLS